MTSPLHLHRVASLHEGILTTIDPLRTMLRDLREGAWKGEPRWMERRTGIAARRERDALTIIPMIANHGLTRVEMTWRQGTRVVARFTLPCDKAVFPAAHDASDDAGRYLDLVKPIVDAETVLACVHALTDAALDLLDPQALYDIEHDWSLQTPLMRAVDRHVALAGAAAVAASRFGEAHGLASRVQLPSPWASTTLMQFDGIELGGVETPLQTILDASCADLPRFCEISASTPVSPSWTPTRGGALFEVVIRPVNCDLEAPDTMEAMRRVAEFAA